MSGKNVCRICLNENAYLDWNCFIHYQSSLTYKEYYYSLTHLDRLSDDFSTVICRNCSNCLENINTFISKAIEAHNLLLEKICEKGQDLDNENEEQGMFELIFVEETDMKDEIQDFEVHGDCSADGVINKENCKIPESSALLLAQSTFDEVQIRKDVDEKNTLNQLSKIENVDEKNPSNQLPKVTPLLEQKKKRRKKKKQIEIPTCCTICSKMLSSKYTAIRHEKTHRQNRERNCICPECGLKFYDKLSLSIHVKVHSKNREKTYKCEFCDKAFYNKGGLNVHRRIHLGQMIPCTLCTKKYPRQSDLDMHMATHSAARIDCDLKAKKKIYVVCEFCGENVRSVSYKSHSAKHKNVPLFKCSLCDKEFFSRDSCGSHLKLFHKKGKGERTNLILSLKTNHRYSNLYMQQKTCKMFIEK